MAGTGRFARRRRDRQDDHLPLPPGPISNGEFVPAAAGAATTGRSTNWSDDRSTSRRGASASTAAASCRAPGPWPPRSPSSSSPAARPRRRQRDERLRLGAGEAGSRCHRPRTSRACQQALTGSEFIFDVHTHHVIPGGPWVENAPETTSLGARRCCRAGCTDTPTSSTAWTGRTTCTTSSWPATPRWPC